MNGNQAAGGEESTARAGGGADFESFSPSSALAVSQAIYVGRGWFRVALDFEATPAPIVDATTWFEPDRAAPEAEAEATLASASEADATLDTDGVPIPYDSVLYGVASRRFKVSPFAMALPLAFGALFIGLIVMPPPASWSFSAHRQVPTQVVERSPSLPTAPKYVTPVVMPLVVNVPPRVSLAAATSADWSKRSPGSGSVRPPQAEGRSARKAGLSHVPFKRFAKPVSSASSAARSSRSSASGAAPVRPWVDPWAGG
jgi:hypothetical protein